MAEKIFYVQIFFNFFPKKTFFDYSKSILAIFWCLVWLFRGPQNYIFWLFKSVFWQFLCEKNGRKARDPARRLVLNKIWKVIFTVTLLTASHLGTPLIHAPTQYGCIIFRQIILISSLHSPWGYYELGSYSYR